MILWLVPLGMVLTIIIALCGMSIAANYNGWRFWAMLALVLFGVWLSVSLVVVGIVA